MRRHIWKKKNLDSETMVSVHAVPKSTYAKTTTLFGKLSSAEQLNFLKTQWLPQDKSDVSKQTLLRVKFHNPFQQLKDKLILMIYYVFSK